MPVVSPIHWPYRITQGFGERPEYYSRYWMDWHPWIDLAWENPWDMPDLYSPVEWYVRDVIYSNGGYWYHVYIRTYQENGEQFEFVLGHLDSIDVKKWQEVTIQTKIWVLWNTGDSNGAHLHIGKRTIWDGQIVHYDNWFYWYYSFPIEPYSLSEADKVKIRNEAFMQKYGISDANMYTPMIKNDIITILSKIEYETQSK